jgi:hypothetical protein
MGADGHVASLFPGHAALEERTRLAVAVEGAGIAPPRVTLTLPALSAADSVVILVSGAAKAKTVHSVLGHGTGPGLPRGCGRGARWSGCWIARRRCSGRRPGPSSERPAPWDRGILEGAAVLGKVGTSGGVVVISARFHAVRSTLIVLMSLLPAVPRAAPLGTAFTYQGELSQSGSPANGNFGMRFLLYDSPTGSNTLGAVILSPVVVAGGLFTVELDFGVNPFTGEDRWLEVIVEGVVLSPRQRLSPTPYSLQTRGIFVNQDLDVGIGTTTPLGKLHVDAPAGNGSVILPSDAIGAAEILDEPGQARSEVASLIILTDGADVTMVFGGIYCPASGFVLAVAEAEMLNGVSVGNIPEIQYDVRPVGSVTPPARVFRMSSSVGHRLRQTCVRVFPVQEGLQTFEYFGRSANSEAAPGRAWNPELTLIFLPTQY